MTAQQVPTYVPILKWRLGEYQALFRLAEHEKSAVVPLIELCPPEFDFEAKKFKKTIDEQLEPFANRLQNKWGARPALIDGIHILANERMRDGRHPLSYVIDESRRAGCYAVPVTGLNRDAEYQASIREVCSIDRRGVCVRLSLEDSTDDGFRQQLQELLGKIAVSIDEVDLVLDLAAPNFEPLDLLSNLIVNSLISGDSFRRARTITLAATAFPLSMGAVSKGLSELKRLEWSLYQRVVVKLTKHALRPRFGDYCISGPELVSMDMRRVKPAATVRYATDDAWLIAKGKNVRDNGYAQYRGLCDELVSSPKYLGANFSPGSKYVKDCARGAAKTGSLTTWRWVGTNHHIAKVVLDLSSYFGS